MTASAVWRALTDFQAAGYTLGALHTDAVLLTDDGALLADLAEARILASDAEMNADVARLLTATAIIVGETEAIAAARRIVGDGVVEAALPFLQPAALPRELQRQAKDADLEIADLRNLTAEQLGTKPPEVVPLQRVTWGGVAMIALTIFAASSLIASLTSIGLDTIVDEFSQAIWAWWLSRSSRPSSPTSVST